MPEQQFPPAINGTEQRLDALIAELRAMRADTAPARPEPGEDGLVELREPQRGPARRKRR